MTDNEFRTELNRALPRAHQAFHRACAWDARKKNETARMFYGHGEPRTDEEIIEAAKRAAYTIG